MAKFKINHRKGFTIVELMMTALISTIIVLGVATMLVDSLKGWRRMYERINSVEADGYVARQAFDHWVRQASGAMKPVITNATDSASLTVYYCENKSSTAPDSQADFNWSGQTLTITCTTPSGGTTTQATIPNVVKCAFQESDRAVQMLLTLHDNTNHPEANPISVFSCAYLNSL